MADGYKSISKSKVGSTLDAIFRSVSTRHGFTAFTASELEQLPLFERSGRRYVLCAATGKHRLAKPEEIVRQLVLRQVLDRLKYPLDQVAIEVPVKMGASYASKAADIVVYTDATKLTPHVIIEVKKPRRKDGLDQLHSYMNATGVYYGAWINGTDDPAYQLRLEPNFFESLQRLPGVGEDLDDVKTPITKDQLTPVHNFKEEVQYLENTVLANAGVSAFEEIFKLIFAKLYDEFDKGDTEVMEFRTTTASPEEQYARFNALFRRAADEWSDIFSPTDNIELTSEALIAVASALQTKRFFDADLDVIDAAFEYMINPEQKGDKGQYFTPRPVVKMCVKMLNPQIGERVIDPACGPGGFLIHSLNWVTDRYIRTKFKTNLEKRRSDYATTRLVGLDFDRRLARVAKAMMLIAGDGRSNIFRVSTLDEREWKGRPDGLVNVASDESFSVLMTNPPFAGSITQPEVLGRYDLAYRGEGARRRRANSMTRDVLFIERCIHFLRPGGRMAIVLPQGNLNNSSAEFIRSWLRSHARVLAVVGLHENTFKPFTNTKTSVLFVQRWMNREAALEDYPIFMAVNERPVKDTSGDYVYELGGDGEYVVDASGRRVAAHDLDEIADAFVKFARSQKFDFGPE